MATGTGSALGAGPGWTTILGALLPSTTAAGHLLAAPGAGAQDPSLQAHSAVQHSSALSAADLALGLVAASAAESDGSRWALANRSIRGSIPAGRLSTTLTSATRAST